MHDEVRIRERGESPCAIDRQDITGEFAITEHRGEPANNLDYQWLPEVVLATKLFAGR